MFSIQEEVKQSGLCFSAQISITDNLTPDPYSRDVKKLSLTLDMELQLALHMGLEREVDEL